MFVENFAKGFRQELKEGKEKGKIEGKIEGKKKLFLMVYFWHYPSNLMKLPKN